MSNRKIGVEEVHPELRVEEEIKTDEDDEDKIMEDDDYSKSIFQQIFLKDILLKHLKIVFVALFDSQ